MPLFDMGGVLNGFLPDKITQQVYSPGVQAGIETTAANAGNVYNANNADINQYSTDLNTAKGQIAGLQPQDMATLSGLIQKYSNADSQGSAESFGNYELNALKGFSSQLANQNSLGVRMANSAYNPSGGGSSYGNSQLLNNISANLAPVFSSIMAGLPSAASMFGANDRANYGVATDAINQRAAIPMRTPNLDILPISQRNNNLAASVAAYGGLGQDAVTNTAGWLDTKNPWVAAAGALDSVGNTAADMVASAYTGGAVGGPNSANATSGGSAPSSFQATPAWQLTSPYSTPQNNGLYSTPPNDAQNPIYSTPPTDSSGQYSTPPTDYNPYSTPPTDPALAYNGDPYSSVG